MNQSKSPFHLSLKTLVIHVHQLRQYLVVVVQPSAWPMSLQNCPLWLPLHLMGILRKVTRIQMLMEALQISFTLVSTKLNFCVCLYVCIVHDLTVNCSIFYLINETLTSVQKTFLFLFSAP